VSLLSEIRRRRIVRGTVAYAVAGWLLIQLAIALEAALELPAWVDRLATIGVICGFPIALFLFWFFDITPGGVGSETNPALKLATEDSASGNARPEPPKHSIAVLPFADMSADRNQEYLGDGVAEEILNALVKVTPLKVSGRTSSFSFKNGNKTVSEIGDALSVSYVLEGSIRKQGDQVRITAQLVQSSDGFHLWSETYEGDISDIFDLQDTIARKIVEELELVLHIDQLRLVANMTKSSEAYEAFLKGRKLAQVQDGDGVLGSAIRHLEEAVREDPHFALAWAWLANANFFMPEHNETADWKKYLDAGKAAARKAYALAPDLSDANLALSYERLLEFDLIGQWEARHRAHELDPSSVAAMHEYGMAYGLMGLIAEGYPYIEKSIRDDPFSPSFSGALGTFQWMLGDKTAANASFDRSVELGWALAATSKALMITADHKSDQAHAYFMQTTRAMKMDLPPELKSWFARWLFSLAFTKQIGWARRLIAADLKKKARNPKVYAGIALKTGLMAMCEPEEVFRLIREKPNTYLSGVLFSLWLPTEANRRMRTHADFPKFAEEIGLVRCWQKHGWPPQVQPNPGTDGSGLKFSCS